MMKNKKLLYRILVVVLVTMGVGLFILSKPLTTSSPEGRVIIKQSGGAGMLIAECEDRNYIADTADYIIEGVVEKVEKDLMGTKPGVAFTHSILVIEKYIKGAPFKENRIDIITEGGCLEDICMKVEDQPIFHEGKKVRIYFKEKNGEFSIVCGEMGVEEIIGKAQLLNPVSVYCLEQGGKWEIRKDKEGNESGFCLFEDGSECEEWKFFRKECKKGERFCKDLCGDGICQEVVCQAIGCPCPETLETCSEDCK